MNLRDIALLPKDEPLREDVRLLGALVGDVIREQGGESLFEAVEAARQAAIRRREGVAGAAADVEALGRIQADEVARLAEETMDDACEAMFIACSQLPTKDILDDLASEFGKPVWSSIKATAWHAERVLDRRNTVAA